MKLTVIFLAIAFCLPAVAPTFAQSSLEEPYLVPSISSGEIASREIDAMAVEAGQSGERLFVIVHLGTGETSRRLSLARLYNTRAYVSGKSFDQSTTVFAEGERVDGEARIEFYLGGRLRLVVLAKRNKMPKLTCCEEYFPPAQTKPRKPRRLSPRVK